MNCKHFSSIICLCKTCLQYKFLIQFRISFLFTNGIIVEHGIVREITWNGIIMRECSSGRESESNSSSFYLKNLLVLWFITFSHWWIDIRGENVFLFNFCREMLLEEKEEGTRVWELLLIFLVWCFYDFFMNHWGFRVVWIYFYGVFLLAS